MADLTSAIQSGLSLGQAFSGTNSPAYNQAFARTAQRDQLLAEAQARRQKQMALESLPKTLSAAGYDQPTSNVLQQAILAGVDPTKLSGYRGAVQEQGFRGNSVASALAGDWGAANANLMGVANGPVDLATVQGQNLINNRLLPGGGGVSTTDQGRAGIAADQARATASYASANSSNAAAQAALGRLAIAQGQYGLQKEGKWNPSGKQTGAGGSQLPVGALKELLGVEDALGGTTVLNDIIQKNAARLADGTLKISPANALFAKGRTALGVANDSDVALNEWNSDLTKIVNESLRLNKGVQTEGDAQRAANELMNANDPKTVAAALRRLAEFNKQAVALQQRKANLINSNYGRAASPGVDLGAVLSGASPAQVTPAVAPAQRAVNPATGQAVVLVNGQWVPE